TVAGASTAPHAKNRASRASNRERHTATANWEYVGEQLTQSCTRLHACFDFGCFLQAIPLRARCSCRAHIVAIIGCPEGSKTRRRITSIESEVRHGSWLDRTLRDRKSTRLNSSHVKISYAVF